MTPGEPTEAQLAGFQAALLDLLAQDLPPEEVRRLAEDAALAPFAAYVRTFEPRMLATAAQLVKKWGSRGG